VPAASVAATTPEVEMSATAVAPCVKPVPAVAAVSVTTPAADDG